MKIQYILGIDIGGTNVKFGLLDPQSRMIARSHLATKSYSRCRRDLISAIFRAAKDLLLTQGVPPRRLSGIGIGLPGAVDPYKGLVISLPNIPGWNRVPLQDMFEKEFAVPAILENDVNLITLGEWKYGAGKGYENLVCMTLGTGVGGGLVFNGSLYRGEGFVAGEIGHMPLNETGPSCTCGGYGCFERYVGNSSLFAEIDRIFKKPGLRIQDVHRLAARGDPRAVKFWETVGTRIGNALTGVVNLLNPPLVIIGGGVSNNFRFFYPALQKVIKARAMKVQSRMVKIVRAKLGDDAGILGAKVLIETHKRALR